MLLTRSIVNVQESAYCPVIRIKLAVALRFTYGSDGVQFFGGWLGIGLTLILAALSWKYFEKPLLRRAHAYRY